MHFTIVSYTFPPSKEIGGRRWAKFSQHIIKSGHEVTVVCADNSGSEEWFNREFTGISVKSLPKRYPDWLSGITNTFIEKLLYLLFTRVLTHLTKQNFFDRGFAWKKSMLNALEDIHLKKKIDVLVVTGAPFSLLYYGALFKKAHSEIFYISDFRDPWTWGSYYGIPKLNKRKKKYQQDSESFCISESNLICSPTEFMNVFLKNKYKLYNDKFYLLPHAYEPDKLHNVVRNDFRKGYIYGGSLYPGIEGHFKTLSKILKSYPKMEFKWTIYTGTHYPLIEELFDPQKVKAYPFIPEEQLFNCIASSAAYLAFFPTTDKDLVSTKFFEIIYTETPIIYIGDEGEVGKFIRENRLGVHILPEKMENELPQYLNGNVPFEKGYFDVTRYSFDNVTHDFLTKISECKN